MTAAHLTIDPKWSNHNARLIELGFVPGLPTYEINQAPSDRTEGKHLTVKHVKRALFESTYTKPRVLPLEYEDAEQKELAQPLPMIVELAQAIHIPLYLRADNRALGCEEYPDWYLRGYLYRSPLGISAETVRMHVYLTTETDTEDIETITVQLVHQATTVEPDVPVLPGGTVLARDD